MSEPERFEVLILGSGQGGKLLAWHMARLGRDGRRGAPLDRRVLSQYRLCSRTLHSLTSD